MYNTLPVHTPLCLSLHQLLYGAETELLPNDPFVRLSRELYSHPAYTQNHCSHNFKIGERKEREEVREEKRGNGSIGKGDARVRKVREWEGGGQKRKRGK